MQARLLLQDGTLFTGTAFGAEGEKTGEVVFNTGITGYQEVLSDPSYCGQIVTMTYPLIGNYGITRDDFESVRPFVHGFVVRRHEEVPSNWRAEYSVDDLLKEYDIPGISEIDTRMLTRIIRHYGTMKAILTTSNKRVEELMEMMGNTTIEELRNQVARTSTASSYSSPGNKERIVLVDYGAKAGILRELNERGCDVVVVPHDVKAEEVRRLNPDGILLSNGPGDPKDVPHAVKTISELLGEYPIFGICLGHQLFALACGADTEKLKFGHRGGNHPVKELESGRCFITSQNHGYTVNEESVKNTELEVTHINNNDKTVEGIKHTRYPAFSVQYHPEAAPGPHDSSYLFDRFLQLIADHKAKTPVVSRQAQLAANARITAPKTNLQLEAVKGLYNMPKNDKLKKILVIGSGPIVIGQAAEFDYAGTQACQALKEEGVEVVLINSNPATIMTDTNIADKVYIEPITLEFVTAIIRQERPDGLLPTLGGQTGLNMAVELARAGVLEQENVKLLGTQLDSIEKAEDRDLFRDLMRELEQPVPDSTIVTTLEEAMEFAEGIGFPLIVRPAYTLGGTGGGICDNEEELRETVKAGIRYSPIGQCLVEKSIAGMKEVEYEVMRDANDNCIVVCNMENFDPVGVHTGDSIVVAPSQTLSDREYQMLRTASLKIIRALNIEGGCNVQFALDPQSYQYYVIEVNPRVSRSSALASKATGYPIAKMAAKIAMGYTLDEIVNPVTEQTYACFEPTLDYIVSKIPRWPFDKFIHANRKLGTQMKATGEVMAIGRTFEESIHKAIRSLEIGVHRFRLPGAETLEESVLRERLAKPDDERLFLIAEAFRRGYGLQEIQDITNVDWWFLSKIEGLINFEEVIRGEETLSAETLYQAKRKGFTDRAIAEIRAEGQANGKFTKEADVRALRLEQGLTPVFKMVDTCAAEFEATTPYYYSTYETENEVIHSDKQKVIVLGSGPIRIGQGIEFDYSTVHAVWAIQKAGYEAVIINNNPETVSTDFNTSDRLYFEPLFFEDVMNVIAQENPIGVIVQFGGQTAINLAAPLSAAGVKILGTSLDSIDEAENRKKFEALLARLDIAQPKGKTVTDVDQAVETAQSLGYPVLVRPSYVLGGRAMEIVYNDTELLSYMVEAVKVNPEHPVLIDRYMLGKEVEVDAICDGETVVIPGIMEHVERAGVHSGDSIAVYPPQYLDEGLKAKIAEITIKIAKELKTIGLVNIQFVIYQNEVYVIEVNPRSSRTVPFLSKVTGIPMAHLATKIILGSKLKDDGYTEGLWPESDYVSVKVPVFSFAKLRRVEPTLGPEMKSTGEVMGRDKLYAKALYKGLIGAGMKIPATGAIIVTVADKDKAEAVELMKGFHSMGYKIIATGGTAQALEEAGLNVMNVNKLDEGAPNILDLIRGGQANFVFNTLTKGKTPERDGFRIRREAVENGVVCMTSLDTVTALLRMLQTINFSSQSMPAFVGQLN